VIEAVPTLVNRTTNKAYKIFIYIVTTSYL